MSTAAQLFVAYGVIIATWGVLLGTAVAGERNKAPEANAYLMAAHVEALMQGPIHLGLGFAVTVTAFDSGAATLGALLLLAGSALNAVGNVVNWRGGTTDQFAERSPGFLFNAASGPLITVGIVITMIGVLANL